MTSCAPVLLAAIDDDAESLALVRAALDDEAFEIICADDLDLMMPLMGGMEVLDEIVRFDPLIEVVLVTAHYSTESAVAAVRRGASDYIEKPIDIPRLRERLGVLADAIRRRRRVVDIDTEIVKGIIGHSRAMLDMFARIGRIWSALPQRYWSPGRATL